ncbi:MAG: hypothetical protein FJZ89_12790 [Chloroflexi bacterium]|nr:hypothetical protein [Chloroflexota bacterium]
MNIYLHRTEPRARAGDPGRGNRKDWQAAHSGEGRGNFNHGYHTFAAYLDDDGNPRLAIAEPGSTRQGRCVFAIRWAQGKFGKVDAELLKVLWNMPCRRSKTRVAEYAAIAQALVARGCTDEDWADFDRATSVVD